MVFRIHFTTKDLARTHVARAPMPMSELDLAARALQDRSQPARLDAWRRRSRPRLPARARMALSVIPPVGWSFAAPALAGRPEDVLDRMRAMPRKEIDATLGFIAERQPLPSWTRRVADDPELFGELVEGFADLHAVLLGPHESQLADLLAADRAVRVRQLLDGGVEGLFDQLGPQWMRWNPPVLEIRMANGAEYDLFLQGRGLRLMPSMFGTRPIVAYDGESKPTVIYPAGRDLPLRRLTALTPEHRPGSAIAALLGHTRASVLNTIAERPCCSTKELAASLNIAPASASEHATVLRQAGLINTVRHRNTALHSLTDLGTALLNGA